MRLHLEWLEDRFALAVVVSVDAALDRHAINPNVYGLAFADQAALRDLNVPLNRHGGNLTTRYNWQSDAANHALDWYFESLAKGNGTPGGSVDSFIADTRAGGAQPVITIPMIDWVAKLGPNRGRLASYSVAKYGAQQSTDYWFPDAGNGTLANGQPITWNNPNDANRPSDPTFQRGWLEHLVSQWGTAANGGVRSYNLDNEPGLWHETHRDVHPNGVTMEELRDKIIAFASMIRSVDPTAQIVGPEEWGWAGYIYSGADLQYGNDHGWNGWYPDRAAHGNRDMIPWLLDQLHQHDVAAGTRSLDVFTLHYYPQGGEFSSDVSTAMQLRRNRSTRSLWDPTYVDESWIDDRVRLIPRMKEWVTANYPGLEIGLTEYNWGAERHVNGATTQADVLGILGREGLDRANFWTTPAAGTPQYDAFRIYRNYDGQRSTFGDVSVRAGVANPDEVSAFAAQRSSDGALTVMLVNKNLYSAANPGATTSITVNLDHFASGAQVERWQLAAVDPRDPTRASITRLSDLTTSGSNVTLAVPMQSVTLLVLRPQVQPPSPQPGTLQFSTASLSANENEGGVLVTVTRSGGSDGTVSVAYAAGGGTASAGQDFQATSGILTFASGETSKTFRVFLIDDSTPESGESIALALSNATGGAALGQPARAVLTIADDDVSAPALIQFNPIGYTTRENWRRALVVVTRTGNLGGTVAVSYGTIDGNARSGRDYTSVAGTLIFGPGETSKTVVLSIRNDRVAEPLERFSVQLRNPTGGALLGAATATVTVQDDDGRSGRRQQRAILVSDAAILGLAMEQPLRKRRTSVGYP